MKANWQNIRRMTSYLEQNKPRHMEEKWARFLVEMGHAISDIEPWELRAWGGGFKAATILLLGQI